MTQKDTSITRLIRCPNCQNRTRYDATNIFRPFCSERCKNADIVSWAEERYQIPSPVTAEDAEGNPQPGDDDDEDVGY
jgi:uncharacterized protein